MAPQSCCYQTLGRNNDWFSDAEVIYSVVKCRLAMSAIDDRSRVVPVTSRALAIAQRGSFCRFERRFKVEIPFVPRVFTGTGHARVSLQHSTAQA
jgi:hypothetical protein